MDENERKRTTCSSSSTAVSYCLLLYTAVLVPGCGFACEQRILMDKTDYMLQLLLLPAACSTGRRVFSLLYVQLPLQYWVFSAKKTRLLVKFIGINWVSLNSSTAICCTRSRPTTHVSFVHNKVLKLVSISPDNTALSYSSTTVSHSSPGSNKTTVSRSSCVMRRSTMVVSVYSRLWVVGVLLAHILYFAPFLFFVQKGLFITCTRISYSNTGKVQRVMYRYEYCWHTAAVQQ